MACPFCHKEHEYGLEEALNRLARGPKLLREAVADASERELAFPEPKPGGWTPFQVAAHLMDTEVVYSMRFRKLLAEDNPVLPAFDQERWAAALQYGRSLADILHTYELLRKQNLGLLQAAPEGALDRTGRHPEYGTLSLRDHLLHIADHDAKHAAQIRRIREAWGRSATAHA